MQPGKNVNFSRTPWKPWALGVAPLWYDHLQSAHSKVLQVKQIPLPCEMIQSIRIPKHVHTEAFA